MESSHFGFIYSRKYKQYFLFIDAYSGEDIERDGFNAHCTIMEIYVIKGGKLVFIEQFNIVIHNLVFTSPTSPWSIFGDELSYHGYGKYNKFMESEWKVFVEHNNIACSDDPVSCDF